MDTEEDRCVICDGERVGEETEDLHLMSSTHNAGVGDSKQQDCFQMFHYCFNLKFPKMNKYGKFNKLCSECISILKQSYKFKKSAEVAHMRLYAHILNWNDDIKVAISLPSKSECTFASIDIDNIKTEIIHQEDVNEDTLDDWNNDIGIEFEEVKNEELPEIIKEIKNSKPDITCSRKKNKRNNKKLIINNRDSKPFRTKGIMLLEPIPILDNDEGPTKIMDILKKKFKSMPITVNKMKSGNKRRINRKRNSDETDGWSDCSTNTEEIYMATGYYSENNVAKSDIPQFKKERLKDGTQICPICQKEDLNINILRKHYAQHFPIGLCHICGQTVSSVYGYTAHLNSHKVTTNEFVCKPCNKVFKTKDTLRGHNKFVHKGIKAVMCYHCPKQFTGSISRIIHMNKVHDVQCNFYYCNRCDLKFYSKSKLKKHDNRVHVRKLSFFCDACSSGFVDRSELKLHIRYKHGDKADLPHCDMCGRAFASHKGLKQHMKIHLNIRDHKCPFCDQAFVQKPSLDCHLKKHHKTQ